jgi:hypothetical protein
MDLIQKLFELTQKSLLPNITYDVIKIVFGFLVARYIFEGPIMRWLWGGWQFIVMDKDEVKDSPRELSPAVAKRILNDEREFSVYAKGVVSPYTWLNIDLVSQEAKRVGILEKNSKERQIIIHIDKNPTPATPKQPSNTDILKRLESFEKSVLNRLASSD